MKIFLTLLTLTPSVLLSNQVPSWFNDIKLDSQNESSIYGYGSDPELDAAFVKAANRIGSFFNIRVSSELKSSESKSNNLIKNSFSENVQASMEEVELYGVKLENQERSGNVYFVKLSLNKNFHTEVILDQVENYLEKIERNFSLNLPYFFIIVQNRKLLSNAQESINKIGQNYALLKRGLIFDTDKKYQNFKMGLLLAEEKNESIKGKYQVFDSCVSEALKEKVVEILANYNNYQAGAGVEPDMTVRLSCKFKKKRAMGRQVYQFVFAIDMSDKSGKNILLLEAKQNKVSKKSLREAIEISVEEAGLGEKLLRRVDTASR